MAPIGKTCGWPEVVKAGTKQRTVTRISAVKTCWTVLRSTFEHIKDSTAVDMMQCARSLSLAAWRWVGARSTGHKSAEAGALSRLYMLPAGLQVGSTNVRSSTNTKNARDGLLAGHLRVAVKHGLAVGVYL